MKHAAERDRVCSRMSDFFGVCVIEGMIVRF